MHYLYILKSKKTHKLYIGQTADLKRRFNEHNTGMNKSTRHGYPWELVYYEAFMSSKDAKHRERQLKHFGQSYAMLKKRLQNSLEDS